MSRYPDIDPRELGDVVIGCANQAGEDNRNIARMSVLLAGLPVEVPAQTVNRLCASGMSAAMDAARVIQTGDAGLMLACGADQHDPGTMG
jgi:acetyl-CoA acetyltransferase